MDVQNGGQEIGHQPSEEPGIQPPGQPPRDQNPPTPTAENEPDKNAATAKELGEIAAGERWLIGTGIVAALVNIFIAVIYYGQLQQMRIATEASTRAATLAADALDQSAGQFDRTVRQLIYQTVSQADAASSNKTSAAAAKKAANIARDTLHISERAYVVTGSPNISVTSREVVIPIVNSGHIPSGDIYIVTHEATMNIADPDAPGSVVPIESHWKHNAAESVPIGDPYVLHVPLPALVPEKLNSGHQQIVVVGTISYNDGFPGTTTQVWRFCELAAWNANSKQVQWMPCDSASYLSQIVIDDHYPKDEYH